jgi:chromosome segregation ATPase
MEAQKDEPPTEVPMEEPPVESQEENLGDSGIEFEDEDAYLHQDPDETIEEFAQNPMMDRVQQALFDQLKKTHDRVMHELLDKEAGVAKVKAEREECGVQLYGMQQQLAKLQMTLEQAHAKFNDIADDKGSDETEITSLKEGHLAEKAALTEISKQVVKNQVRGGEGGEKGSGTSLGRGCIGRR